MKRCKSPSLPAKLARRALLAVLFAAPVAAAPPEPLRLDQIQVVGSHNSYKRAISPRLFAYYQAERPGVAAALDYWHPSLTEQLDHGLRGLELDVFHDPEGGRYATPGGLEWAPEGGDLSPAMFDLSRSLAQPGFKVLHVQDLDFRSSCPTWIACLLELRTWSNRHPGHLPIVVTVNAKDAPIEREGFVVPLAFDRAALDALDRATVRVLGRDKLLVPDDVRGRRETLERAVVEDRWPRLDAVRGRFLFVLDEKGGKRDAYLEGRPALEGRAFFVDVEAGHPAAAVRILNDPIAQAQEIREAVTAGYLVRTRADADTREARLGTTDRRDAAIASGAHFVSTDYYLDEQVLDTGYRVSLPARGEGAARCNPVSAPGPCSLAPAPAVVVTPKLIAHRGGVVGPGVPENSRAAIAAAIERGYWMLEVDLRETRDGEIVLHHDPDFSTIYGDAREVAELVRSQIERLRMTENGESPVFLDELIDRTRGRLRLMLDWKTRSPMEGTLSELARSLERAGMLEESYVIGTPQARRFFTGRARVGASLQVIEDTSARGENVPELYFLFEHGRDLTGRDLLRAYELGVTVVPSVNRFHYADLEAPELAARADLERLSRMGVTELQIDSEYERWLLAATPARAAD